MNLPIDFTEKMKMLLGDEYNEFEKSYSIGRNYGLRINTLKVSVEDFLKKSPFELNQIPWTKEGFYYNEEDRPTKHPYYYAGLYYIQEPSAMAPGEFIGIHPGDKVLDLCAAPGGKSTQVAAKLADKGLLVSNDINENRTKALVKNIEIFGVKNAVITNESPEKLSQRFEGFFDKILVDAPCSGEGMFRKDEDAAKSWSKYSNERCSIMQKNILYHAAKMLKPEGNILYSTCTFSPEENECIINEFLQKNINFELIDIPKHSGIESGNSIWADNNNDLEKCARFWPHKVKGEGHFLALLRKKEGKEIVFKENRLNTKIDIKLFNDFCKQYLEHQITGNFELYGQYLYLSPEQLPNLQGIKVVRPGLFLGILKKDRFEPSHALAIALKPQDIRNIINLSKEDDMVIRYLKGETLEMKAQKGYNLICVDNYSLGWAKGAENILKNEYPAGWRMINGQN